MRSKGNANDDHSSAGFITEIDAFAQFATGHSEQHGTAFICFDDRVELFHLILELDFIPLFDQHAFPLVHDLEGGIVLCLAGREVPPVGTSRVTDLPGGHDFFDHLVTGEEDQHSSGNVLDDIVQCLTWRREK